VQKLNKSAQTIAEKLLHHKDGLHNVKIATNDQGMVLSLLDKSFFDAGSAAIKPGAYPVLNTISSQLAHMPNPIHIEGNTDNGRIHTAHFPSNWELSSARAISVVRFLIDKGHVKAERLSATGYADTHPLMSNLTAEGRQRNRRVDIVVVKEQEKGGLGALTPVEIKQPKPVPTTAVPESVFKGPFGNGFSNPFQKP
jgi:flagellar motor protein MotB